MTVEAPGAFRRVRRFGKSGFPARKNPCRESFAYCRLSERCQKIQKCAAGVGRKTAPFVKQAVFILRERVVASAEKTGEGNTECVADLFQGRDRGGVAAQKKIGKRGLRNAGFFGKAYTYSSRVRQSTHECVPNNPFRCPPCFQIKQTVINYIIHFFRKGKSIKKG